MIKDRKTLKLLRYVGFFSIMSFFVSLAKHFTVEPPLDRGDSLSLIKDVILLCDNLEEC